MTFNPTNNTLTLTSTITTIIGVGFGGNIEVTGNWGTITVTTGPLISGSILNSGVFDGGTITLNVTDSISTGNINFTTFTMFGTFNNGTQNTPLAWWTDKSGDHHLALEANQIGTGMINGEFVNILDFGQLAVSSGPNQYNIIQGRTTIPEPGSVVLVATGLGLLATRSKSQWRKVFVARR